jgi:hypothetical protein
VRPLLYELSVGLGWRAKTVVVMMWAYFDESGEHGPDGKLIRLTLGGFMAPWEAVQRLDQRWKAALDAEGMDEFHMKDWASDEDRFADWPARRQERLRRFTDILCEEGTEFGGFSYTGQGRFGLFRELYQTGFNRALINFDSFCERHGERGHIVFAKTTEISGKLIGGYFDRLHWEHLAGYSVVKSSDCRALQAAEIPARGMKRLMQDGGITYSFARILLEAQKQGKEFRSWPQDPFAAAHGLGHGLRLAVRR